VVAAAAPAAAAAARSSESLRRADGLLRAGGPITRRTRHALRSRGGGQQQRRRAPTWARIPASHRTGAAPTVAGTLPGIMAKCPPPPPPPLPPARRRPSCGTVTTRAAHPPPLTRSQPFQPDLLQRARPLSPKRKSAPGPAFVRQLLAGPVSRGPRVSFPSLTTPPPPARITYQFGLPSQRGFTLRRPLAGSVKAREFRMGPEPPMSDPSDHFGFVGLRVSGFAGNKGRRLRDASDRMAH